MAGSGAPEFEAPYSNSLLIVLQQDIQIPKHSYGRVVESLALEHRVPIPGSNDFTSELDLYE